ncbi:MAG: protein kinase [Acidobacteria bacterium]|nr:protein kinase [Acidobacteriota bacterium]
MFRAEQEIGQYVLVRRLGRGGFGEVWLAERRAKFVTTKVAVKLPLDDLIDVESVRQEAVLWEKASGHPNVLPIIDADEYDGQIVIVSEYAPDGSVEDLLRKEGRLPVRKAVELTIGILSGLEFLHARKIIHRDIKPANILLQGETPRLADFGISRIMKTTSVSVHMSGTPGYMAPESFDRKRTVQTDLWSVGVILYQMLKGELPFPYENFTELLGAIVLKEPEPLPAAIPPALSEIVFRALAKKPEERFASALEMRTALADFLIGISQPISSSSVVLPAPADAPTVAIPRPVEAPTVELETVVRSVGEMEATRAAVPTAEIPATAPANEIPATVAAANFEIHAPDAMPKPAADNPQIPIYLKIAAILGVLAVILGSLYLFNRSRNSAVDQATTGVEVKNGPVNPTASANAADPGSPNKPQSVDQTEQNSAEFEKSIKAARSFYEKGDFARAIENARTANRSNPDDYETKVLLGNANFDTENYEESARWYLAALEQKPDEADVRTDLGLTYAMRKSPDFDRAIDEFDKALASNPNHQQALQNLTFVYIKKGDAARAAETLARFEKVDPKNPAIPKLRDSLRKITPR